MVAQNETPFEASGPPLGNHLSGDRGTKRPPSSSPESVHSKRKKGHPGHDKAAILPERPALHKPRNEPRNDMVDSDDPPRRDLEDSPSKPSNASAANADESSHKTRDPRLTISERSATNGSTAHNGEASGSHANNPKGIVDDPQGGDVAQSTSVANILAELHEQAAILAAFHTSLLQAEAKLTRASREYNTMQPQFSTFPAILDNKRASKVKAASLVEKQKQLYSDEKAKYMAIAQKLPIELMNWVVTQLPRTDQVSREEFEHHKIRFAKLEFKYHSGEARQANALATIHHAVDETSEEVRGIKTNMDLMDDKLKQHVSDTHKQLAEEKKADKINVQDLNELKLGFQTKKECLRNLDNAFDDLKGKFNASRDDLEDQVDKIENRLSKMEFSQERRKDQDFVPRAEFDGLLQQMKNMSKRFDELQGGGRASSVPEGLESRVATLEQDIDAINEENIRRDNAISITIADRAEELARELEETKETVTELIKGFEDVKGETEKLKAAEIPSHHHPTPPQFVPLSPASPRPAHATTSVDLTGPSQDRDHVADTNPRVEQPDVRSLARDVQGMKSSVAMLQQVSREHKRVLDNVTTDVVVRQMLDQFGRVYAPAGNLMHKLDAVQSELAAMQTRLNDTIETNQGSADAAAVSTRESHEQLRHSIELTNATCDELVAEVKRLQEELSKLTGRVRVLETPL